MKKYISLFLICVILLLSFSSCAEKSERSEAVLRTDTSFGPELEEDVAAGERDAVGNLRINYERSPNCVEENPDFSWNLLSSVRGAKQTSYRIKVADSEEALGSEELVWDSGTVESDACVGIPCEGKLREATNYYWNVTLTNERSEEITSAASAFTTALFETEFDGAGWITDVVSPVSAIDLEGANWIWLLNGEDFEAGTEYFRCHFTSEGTLRSAVVAVTGDDSVELYLNGRAVASEEECGGWSGVTVRDVTDFVREGDNVFAASCVNGDGPGALILKLCLKYADGTEKTVVTNDDWLASKKEHKHWSDETSNETDYQPVDYLEAFGGGAWGGNVVYATATEVPSLMLRKTFTLEKKEVETAVLYASAAGLYEAYCNGEKLGDGVLNPGRTEYDVRVKYQCYDVTNQLRQGDNAIGAILGHGWWLGADAPYGARNAAFIAKLVVRFTDGSTQTVGTDGSWRLTDDGPIRCDDPFDGETFDARREPDGWSEAVFNDAAWAPAEPIDADVLGIGKLEPQLTGVVKEMDRLNAVSVRCVKSKTYIYDFGQNLAGVASIRVTGNEGDVVTLRHAEMLNDKSEGSDGKAGTLYTANLRSAKATDTYILKGDPNGEIYTPRFTFHGFRYLEISGLSEALPLEDVAAVVLYSDMEDTGTLSTSDDLINQLACNTYWGQRSNFLSVPTDCPQRDERMGWSGDAEIFCGTAAYNMNVKTFFDQYITALNDAQELSGAYPDVAPQHKRSGYSGTGNAGWGDAGLIIPWTMYTRYGDRSYIEKYYDNMVSYAEYLLGGSNDHIRRVSWTGDWLSMGEDTDIELIDTAYCVYAMDLMEKMALLLEKTDDAARFADEAEAYREAWNKAFVTGDGKLTCDSQTAYLLALAFEILPEGSRQAFADTLAKKVEDNGSKLTTGFIGCPLLLPVLSEYGHTQTAFALLQQEDFPSWKYPILQGATTIWERWNSYTIKDGFGDAAMNSFNHYSYGSVTEWIYDTLIGIACDEDAPGFSHFILRPTCGGGLTHAEGSYLSMYGLIRSVWEAENDEMTSYRCTVPANTTATLYLPAQSLSSVSENGKSLSDAKGVSIVSEKDGSVELLLDSGSYVFTLP